MTKLFGAFEWILQLVQIIRAAYEDCIERAVKHMMIMFVKLKLLTLWLDGTKELRLITANHFHLPWMENWLKWSKQSRLRWLEQLSDHCSSSKE